MDVLERNPLTGYARFNPKCPGGKMQTHPTQAYTHYMYAHVKYMHDAYFCKHFASNMWQQISLALQSEQNQHVAGCN